LPASQLLALFVGVLPSSGALRAGRCRVVLRAIWRILSRFPGYSFERGLTVLSWIGLHSANNPLRSGIAKCRCTSSVLRSLRAHSLRIPHECCHQSRSSFRSTPVAIVGLWSLSFLIAAATQRYSHVQHDSGEQTPRLLEQQAVDGTYTENWRPRKQGMVQRKKRRGSEHSAPAAPIAVKGAIEQLPRQCPPRQRLRSSRLVGQLAVRH
jgi:hypothetical protein